MRQLTVFQGFATKKEDCSLKQIITDITEGKYKRQVELIRYAISDGNISKARELKKKLLAFTPSGVYDKERKPDNLNHYSGLIILDIDNLTTFDLIRVVSLIQLVKYTLASFISPSGNGVKIIVPVDSDKENHKNAFNQVVKYYQSVLGVDIDTSGSDLVRLCYMSYDPNCYFNIKAETFLVDNNDNTINISKKGDSINHETSNIENYTRLIEETKTDITRDYKDWVKIGFALSKEFGELGRDYYHRISKFYEGYNYEECDKQFNTCLKSSKKEINISTFFYLAHKSNIKPIDKEDLRDSDEGDNMKVPHFPQTLYPQLPKFLQGVIHHSENPEEKDVMVLGALTVLSACFKNLYAIYDGSKVFANLYLFITAIASAGKGKVNLCRRLVYPIHKFYKEEYERLYREYLEVIDDEDIDKEDYPPEPLRKIFIIPANNSSTGIFEILNNNDGSSLIFETEAEALANAFKTDYGNYSEGFRKAFHHETISYYRRTKKEYIDIENPRLSTVLSGTPKQVLTLIPDAENGLFSRFIFYHMAVNTEWKNVFKLKYGDGLDGYFDILGEDFFNFFKRFNKKGGIKFSYTKDQEDEFTQFFNNLNSIYLSVNNIQFIATIRRMGLIIFRIGMVLTALRCMENDKIPKDLVCSDIDFRNSLEIAKVLFKHSSKVYSSLPSEKSPVKYGNKREQFLNNLPIKFTTTVYRGIARNLKIPFKTAEGYITEFVKKGTIIRTMQGEYENPNKNI